MREPAVYSPSRAQQLRAMLWVAVVLAAIFTALSVWALFLGSTLRYSLFLAVPSILLFVAAFRALKKMEERGRPARRAAMLTGILLLVFGLLLAGVTVGILPSIVGVLILLLAMLPDVGDH